MEADLGVISSLQLPEAKPVNLNGATSEQHQDGFLGKTSSLQSSSSRPEHLSRHFPLSEILQATNNFDDILVIGQGGFGKVYKGVIDNGAVPVAMKRLNPTSNQGAPQFWAEVDLVSRFRHSHLVTIIGYCDEDNEMILVYEYMSCGSLSDHLFRARINDNSSSVVKLSWTERLKICIGAAEGLNYLHTGTGINSRVIHRDVKSSNILLDDNFAAKMSDFGLSKVGPANQDLSHVSTNVKGTRGYMDPEYLHTGRLTRKSDVYSFGVVLLEVLSGKRATDPKVCAEHWWGLPGWAEECIKKDEVDHIIDPYLKYELDASSLKEFVQITEKCIRYDSRKRPTMAEVVFSLEHVLAIQERTDSTLFDFQNLGWTSLDNPNGSFQVNDAARHSEIINDAGDGEVIGDAGNSELIDDANNMQSYVDSGDFAIQAAYGELLKVVIDASRTTKFFKFQISDIESTLESIKPEMDQIASSNKLSKRHADTAKFVKKLVTGKKLILICLKIKRWNVIGKYAYSRKLTAFRETLLWFIKEYVQTGSTSDNKKTLVEVESIDDRLRMLLSKVTLLENGGGGGNLDVLELPDLIVGFDKPLKELKKMILDDGVSVVVLSGPGGTGKTTLSKMLCSDVDIQGTIGKKIFFATLSQNASLKDIVHDIFQRSGIPIPLFQNNEDMMNQLAILMRQLVETGPVLLVLDDVWSEWDSYIQKFNFGIGDYKVLITSRFEFPEFDNTYKLNILSKKDSTTLFRHLALKKDDSSVIPDELVNKIVEGCKGSPLALTIIGQSVYGRPMASWTNSLKKLSRRNHIFESTQQESLFGRQTGLEENAIAKECFLDLGYFPANQEIPATLLLDMWIESYGQDDDDTLEILLDLYFENSIDLSPTRKDAIEVDANFNERYVTVDDLTRRLAMLGSNQELIEHRRRLYLEIRDNFYPEWWIEQQEQPNCVRLLSISTDETFESAWYNMQLPSTEVLILNFSSKNYALPPFIKEMSKLKVISVTNSGSFPVELIDFQLLQYLYNLKRIRFQQISVPPLTTSLIQLKHLQKISLKMCRISKALNSCTSDTANIFSNLTELDIDYCDDLVEFPIGLCNLLKLRKFRISYCSKLIALPDHLGRLVNLEMLKINSCKKLEELPESICDLYNLSFLDICGCTRITSLPAQIGNLKSLKVLLMRGCKWIQDLPTSVEYFSELKNVVCDEEILHLWRPYEYQISNLEITVVKEDV